jgi:phosphoribosylanthranilate isomerase
MDVARVTRIKFCGITNLDDADAAVEAGAWALGMIFWPGSKRRCRTADAAMIAATHRRRVELVGVFVNPTLDQVAVAADEIGLTVLQFHGDEGPSFCAEAGRRTGCRVIKAARVRSRAEIQGLAPFHTDFHLFDAYAEGVPGGTGETFAWELARGQGPARLRVPVILAGGLTADNVAEAIAIAHPYAVDVASGTESAPGIKDHDKLRAFAAAVASTQPVAPEETVTPAKTETPGEPATRSEAAAPGEAATASEAATPSEAAAPAEAAAPTR